MYMSGKKYFSQYPNPRPKDDEGYEVEEVRVALGYWRKHANLHGYIVATFAEGEDNCQEIELDIDNLKQLLEVVKNPTQMPKTTGFFFGESANDQEQIDEDVAILTKAVGFLAAADVKQDEQSVWRSVLYRASW